MKPVTIKNDTPVRGFIQYLRVLLGLAIILIGSFSFFYFIFDNPSPPNEQGSFLYSLFYTLFIASGIWLISIRNKSVPGDLSKARFYRSLIIVISVILALVAISFFFD